MPKPTYTIVCPNCSAKLRCASESGRLKCPKCSYAISIAEARSPASTVQTAQVAPLSLDPDEVPESEPASSGWLTPLLILGGLLCGTLMGVLGSAFKSDIGLLGLVVAMALLGMMIVGLLIGRAVLGLSLTVATAEKKLLYSRLRGWCGTTLVFAGSVFALFAIAVVAEAFGPPEGYVKKLMARSEERRKQAELADAERKQQELDKIKQQELDAIREQEKKQAALKLQEKRAWGDADLILVNPSHRAIALQNRGDRRKPKFTVVARAADEETQGPLEIAWNGHIPVLANDPALARKLFEKYNTGAILQPVDTENVYQFARLRPFFPTGTEMVSFVDRTTTKRRIGHRMNNVDERFDFCDLVPRSRIFAEHIPENATPEALFHFETVERTRSVQPGSEIVRPPVAELRSSTDFLEYCIYGMLTRLQAGLSSENWELRPCIYVDDVAIESLLQNQMIANLKSRVNNLKQDKRAPLNDVLNRDESRMIYATGWAALLTVFTEYAHEQEKRLTTTRLTDQIRNEIEEEIRTTNREIRELTRLNEAGQQITKDVRRLLTQAGVVMVERSDRAKGLYCKIDGKQWLGADANEAIADGLVQATHLLLIDTARPREDGTCQISMRLVDVRTSKIIWADNGDLTNAIPSSRNGTILNGRWKDSNNTFTIQITETNSKVRVALVSHAVLDKFELFGTRDGNSITVSACYMVSKQDPTKNQYPSKATMRVIDDTHIEIAAQPLTRTGNRVHVATEMEKMIFEKQP